MGTTLDGWTVVTGSQASQVASAEGCFPPNANFSAIMLTPNAALSLQDLTLKGAVTCPDCSGSSVFELHDPVSSVSRLVRCSCGSQVDITAMGRDGKHLIVFAGPFVGRNGLPVPAVSFCVTDVTCKKAAETAQTELRMTSESTDLNEGGVALQLEQEALQDPQTFFAAVKRLKTMGQKGIEVLSNALIDPTLYPDINSDACSCDQRKEAIIEALVELGQAALPAIPMLLEAFHDASLRPFAGAQSAAATALMKIAPDDKKVLDALVESTFTPGLGVFAANALGRGGANSKPVLPRLKEAFSRARFSYARSGGSSMQAMIDKANAHELMCTIELAIEKIETANETYANSRENSASLPKMTECGGETGRTIHPWWKFW